jgi:hypothetical protein
MYAGALLFSAGTTLLFGSWWGLVAVVLLTVVIAARAVLEEETLKAELDGYAGYAAKVRYRLIPLSGSSGGKAALHLSALTFSLIAWPRAPSRKAHVLA